MMDLEFKTKLKDTLVALESRLAALEHTVNNVLISGLQEAASEYEDEEHFKSFSDSYGADIGKYSDSMKVLCGDDFDLCKEIYEALKGAEGYGTEGFDEKGMVAGKLKDIADKLAKVGKPVEVEVEAEGDEPSDEDLTRIYKERVAK